MTKRLDALKLLAQYGFNTESTEDDVDPTDYQHVLRPKHPLLKGMEIIVNKGLTDISVWVEEPIKLSLGGIGEVGIYYTNFTLEKLHLVMEHFTTIKITT